MTFLSRALREGVIAGALASVFSTVALAIAGRRENANAAAPINATSHWIWADPALREERMTLRHTLVGYLIHHGAASFWATLHALAWGGRPKRQRPLPALAGASAAAAVAAFVDFRMTPQRLTPGFEHRLSVRSLVAVYACFAVGLALGSMAARRREG